MLTSSHAAAQAANGGVHQQVLPVNLLALDGRTGRIDRHAGTDTNRTPAHHSNTGRDQRGSSYS